ncbi:hypothetical protein [Brachybacterium timonense]|uniref:hypothetical protein n=1 Tax=Brachybacterium timonense TaxID=2050896 RepID=UPI000D0B5075|nr:hypothetical protein [Brachybacterium timonense]
MSAQYLPRRTVLASAGAIGVGGLLAACSSEPEAPSAPPTGPALEAPTPVAYDEQLEPVISQIHDAVAEADKARDAKKLAPRVTGSALEFRTKNYEMIAKVPEWADHLKTPSADLMLPITSVGAEFPRVAIALVADSSDSGVPFFVALQQADARSPYVTWGWAQQAVGVEMPAVEDQAVGSEPVAYEQDGLVMTPKAALELYAKVLSDGDAADPDDKLAPNPLQTEKHQNIGQERKELNAGVEWDEVATIKERFTVKEGEFLGLRTNDGGALVMATLMSTRTVTVKEGASMSYGEDNVYTKLVGRKKFTKSFVREFGTVVALHIPAAEAGGQVQPIGATMSVLGASGS